MLFCSVFAHHINRLLRLTEANRTRKNEEGASQSKRIGKLLLEVMGTLGSTMRGRYWQPENM